METNSTYNSIIGSLQCSKRTWDSVKEDLSKVTIRKLPIRRKETTSSYLVFYDGVFSGIFIKESCIDLEELKQIGWKFEGEFDLFA